MLETQPYVKYDTRGDRRYEYSIGHVNNNKVDARVSLSDLQGEVNGQLQYFAQQDDRQEQELNIEELDAMHMSDIFAKKLQDTSILTENMRKTFLQKAQPLLNMLSTERHKQSEIEKAIKGVNKIQSTKQEIDSLTQQLQEIQETSKSEPTKEEDKEL